MDSLNAKAGRRSC